MMDCWERVAWMVFALAVYVCGHVQTAGAVRAVARGIYHRDNGVPERPPIEDEPSDMERRQREADRARLEVGQITDGEGR